MLAVVIGSDGMALLEAIRGDRSARWLREVPAVETLRRIWMQNYVHTSDDQMRWRTTEVEGVPPSACFLSSPHDLDARYSLKNSVSWVGYKVHVTETCEPDAPNLITHVATTPATTADGAVTPHIHAALQASDSLPQTHLVDTGYLDAELLVQSRADYGVDLLGPTRHDQRWQARTAAGFGLEQFVVNWGQHRVICPAGKRSVEWRLRIDVRGNDSIDVRFSATDCGPCGLRERCTRSQAKRPRRSLALRPREQYEALQQRRAYETQPEYVREYAKRAGIEGTLSQGIRRCRLRRSRYVGELKTHHQHLLTATALNYIRTAAWLAEQPRAKTRHSRFAALVAHPR